ncbi:dynamin family protein [Kitasatospora sp. KL5]|uniref:dynamin family protein n=1 Tax=Kitasatospora sp. KL5 TaxID=3425125 RepID=UPI003D6E7349
MDDYEAIRSGILETFERAVDAAGRDGAEATRRSLAEARDILAADRLRPVVLGEFKAGKSSLLNALLDDTGEPPLLPEAEEIATSVAASVSYGDQETIEILRDTDDGTPGLRVDRRGLREHGTEHGNPENRRGVLSVHIRTPSPLLRPGLTLVDTPGLGGPYLGHNAATLAALPGADAVMLVLDSSQPVLRSHLETVRRAASAVSATDTPGALFFVLTKTDLGGYGEVLADTRAKLAGALGRPAAEITVVPVSARAHRDFLAHGDEEDRAAGNLAGLTDALWAALCHRGVPRVLGGALDSLDRGVRALLAPLEGQTEALEDGTRRTVGELRRRALEHQARLAELRKGRAQRRVALRRRIDTVQEELRRDAEERHARIWDRFESHYLEEDAYLTDPQRLVAQLTADAAQVVGEINARAGTATAAVLVRTAAETGLAMGSSRPTEMAAPTSGDLVVRGRLGEKHRSGRLKRRLRDLSFGGSMGTTTGALIGSVVPGLGTAVGAAVGGLVGMAAGWASAGRDLRNEDRRLDRSSLRTQLQPLKRRQAAHISASVKDICEEFREQAEQEMEERIEQEREANQRLVAALKDTEDLTTATAGTRLAELRERTRPLQELRTRTAELEARTQAFTAAAVDRTAGGGAAGARKPEPVTVPGAAGDISWAEDRT